MPRYARSGDIRKVRNASIKGSPILILSHRPSHSTIHRLRTKCARSVVITAVSR